MGEKGLQGIRAPKQGQTIYESMAEQIFELQREIQEIKNV